MFKATRDRHCTGIYSDIAGEKIKKGYKKRKYNYVGRRIKETLNDN